MLGLFSPWRQKKLIFSVRLRLWESSSKMACRLYLAQVVTGSSQNLSGATDVFLLTHRGHRVCTVLPDPYLKEHPNLNICARLTYSLCCSVLTSCWWRKGKCNFCCLWQGDDKTHQERGKVWLLRRYVLTSQIGFKFFSLTLNAPTNAKPTTD